MSVPVEVQTITYRKRGTHPPVFLAGSFTEPQWVPHEMDYTQDAQGEYVYTSQIRVVPGHEYQFKFKLGEGDTWALDENSPVEIDSSGNKNNLLRVPLKGAPKPSRSVPGKVLNELGIVDVDSRTSTPIEQVANTAAEVADTAQKLDQDDFDSSSTGEPEYSWKEQEPVRTPLFAHENFGAYECVDDGLDHETAGLGLSATETHSRSSSKDFALDDIDINDPTIEKFPSDRGSVIDTLRKIQSSLSEDMVQVEAAPVSPREAGYLADDGRRSPGTLNAEVLTPSRKRENRLSSRSMASLGSIPEDPKAEIGGNSVHHEKSAKPRRAVFEGPDTSSPSEGDDAVEWRGKKTTKTGKRRPSSRGIPESIF